MKLLRYLILILLLWGIPSFFSYDVSLGSKLSYLTFGALLLYYFLNTKKKVLYPFITLGLFYFLISGLIHVADETYFILKFIKFIILIVCGAELVRNTTRKEFYIFLILGASTILIHALFFQDGYGRYSGLYLNPNGAGFVCIIGYCLSYSISLKKLRIIGQIIFTIAGIITFSRTFLILWLIVSLISIIANKRNLINFGLGFAAILMVFSLASYIQFNTVRFSAFESYLYDNPSSSLTTIQDDSRLNTWSVYYDMILDRPLFGNGYESLSGIDGVKQGVHNSFLMVLGESGIIPFLIMVGIYLFMLKKSISFFYAHPDELMLGLSLIGILMIMHNYFDNNLIIFTSIWLYVHIFERKSSVDIDPGDAEIKEHQKI